MSDTHNDLEDLPTEGLINLSGWLYEQYLQGEDYLDDLHAISEVLRERKAKEAPDEMTVSGVK
jgi:hypothetical protein